jgi:hypothetical protein
VEGNLLRSAAIWLTGGFLVLLGLTHVVHPGFWNVSSWRPRKPRPAPLVGPPASNATLTAIAARVANSPTSVHCVPNLYASLRDRGLGGPWGAKLDEQVCIDLGYFARVPPTEIACAERDDGLCGGAIDEVLDAMHTLAHESMHIRGIRSETVADCYGLQAVPVVAEGLGASPNEAVALARYFAKHFDEIHRPPADYVSVECRRGGALDLTPQTQSWPD